MSGATHVAAIVLAGAAAALTLVSAVGVAVMRDAYQKLHFIAPPAVLGGPALAVAVWLDAHSIQAGLKALLAVVLLNAMNGVVTHATARAAFVREHRRWPPSPDQGVPVVGREGDG